MDALKVFKAATNIVVSVGAGAVIKNAIRATTPEDVKKIGKIGIVIGGFAISGLVADAAVKHVDNMTDEFVTAVKNARNPVHNITDVE